MNRKAEFMNPSYVQTFNRHRLLFSLPVVILTVLALWFVAGTPKQYKAGASLFVDNPAPQQTSLNNPNPAEITPSAQAQQFLTELLATKRFRLEVGRKGPLSKYFATHASEGWGPTGLLRKLRGSGSVPDRTAAALDAKHVLTTLPGGQVMSIEVHGPTPEVAVGTASALVGELINARRDVNVSRQEGAMTHFKNQADAARAAIESMSSQIAGGGLSTAEVQGLVQARDGAETRLMRATRGYNQAALSLAAARAERPPYHVRDAPGLPAPAVGGIKKQVFGVFAGVFVGLLISFLAIVLLTGSEDKDRENKEREELREVIGRADDLEVEAPTGTNGSSVPQVPRVKATGER